MERETKEITTTGGHKAVIKTYLTARETMPLADDANLTNSKTAELILGQAVVSLDGSTENIGDRLLDLPNTEYAQIAEAVTEIANPTTPQKSAQPGEPTSEAAQ